VKAALANKYAFCSRFDTLISLGNFKSLGISKKYPALEHVRRIQCERKDVANLRPNAEHLRLEAAHFISGHEFSGVLGFTYNFINNATQYQNGVDMHFDWGASQFLTKQVQVGLVGYAYKEIGCDSGSSGQPAWPGTHRPPPRTDRPSWSRHQRCQSRGTFAEVDRLGRHHHSDCTCRADHASVFNARSTAINVLASAPRPTRTVTPSISTSIIPARLRLTRRGVALAANSSCRRGDIHNRWHKLQSIGPGRLRLGFSQLTWPAK
jgi:Putative MetA-pathway of phenol degradation